MGFSYEDMVGDNSVSGVVGLDARLQWVEGSEGMETASVDSLFWKFAKRK